MKKEKAITVISLVITIILLIILTGVVINLSLGENGIINKVKQAKEKYKIEEIRETVELGLLDLQMGEVNLENEVTIERTLQELLDKNIFESIDKEANIGYVGEYEVKLKYDENSKIVIEYIQKATGVRVTYALDPSTYTNKEDVNIQLKVEGKVKSVTKPDGLMIYPKNEPIAIDYKVTSNGAYKFIIENEEGKQIEKNVIVDIIDKLPPEDFEITAKTTRTGGIIINANGKDAEANETNVKSGIERYEYYLKLETENEYKKYDTNEIEGLTTGKYKIYAVAYDKAGNPSNSSPEIEVEIEEWIEIWNEEELRDISKDITRNYILMDDIELTKPWIAIGFQGKLDGNYHKITKLEVQADTDYQGMFGTIDATGKVSNLILECNVTGKEYVGGLVGFNGGTIENVKISGTVRGKGRYIGGLAGLNFTTIKGSYSEVEVIGIDSSISVGGLVGQNNSKGAIVQSSASIGRVSGFSNVGGLVGTNLEGTITDAYSKGEVIGKGNYIGGLIGNSFIGTITNTYTISKVVIENGSYIGGLVGEITKSTNSTKNTTIINSYWTPEKAEIQKSAGGSALTLEQMKTKSSYEGWNFSSGTVWRMGEFPELIFDPKLGIEQ